MTKQRTIELVIWFLGVIGLAALAIAGYLAATHNKIPEQLWPVISGVVVGLPSLLASTRSGGDAAPVVVQNAPDNPVPVDTGT